MSEGWAKRWREFRAGVRAPLRPPSPPPRASDWTGKFTGRSPVALRPRTEAQAAAALARCAARRLAVVPQGGNTGLVGGGVPLPDEVVLSTARRVGVTRVDAAAGVVSARAGTTLAALEAAAAAAGLTIPLDLGARGTCAIGGNVATTAGGARVVRYGTLRSTVLGLDALLADGTRLDLTRPLRKDNTGYDLKQLLIGSEGTLALITGVTLAAPRATVAPALAYLACPTWAAVQDVMGLARARLGEALAAAEFVDAASVALATAHLSHVSNPFPSSAAPYFVLLEAAGVDGDHDAAKMERLVGEAFATGAAVDGVASAAGARPTALWALREGVPVALRYAGACYKYDVSLAVADFEGLVNECQKRATAARGDAVAVGLRGGGRGARVGLGRARDRAGQSVPPPALQTPARHRPHGGHQGRVRPGVGAEPLQGPARRRGARGGGGGACGRRVSACRRCACVRVCASLQVLPDGAARRAPPSLPPPSSLTAAARPPTPPHSPSPTRRAPRPAPRNRGRTPAGRRRARRRWRGRRRRGRRGRNRRARAAAAPPAGGRRTPGRPLPRPHTARWWPAAGAGAGARRRARARRLPRRRPERGRRQRGGTGLPGS